MQNKNLWFGAKRYGWGWTPITWQGWAATIGYIVIVVGCTATLDEQSPPREVIFMGVLPTVLATIALIRICYKKGEPPRWRWGK